MRKFALLFAIILFASCVSTLSSTTEGTTEEPSGETKIQSTYALDDVPLPAGFKVNKDKSFLARAGSYRSGILYCSGDLSPQEVKEFFLNTLPDYDWKLVNSFEGKEVFLNFSKPGWLLNIQIFPTMGGSEIKIMIAPVEGGKKIG